VFFVRASSGPGGNVGPVVTLAVSQSSAAVGTFVTLTANASDPDGSVVKVEYYRDGVQVRRDDQGPASIRLHAGRRRHLQLHGGRNGRRRDDGDVGCGIGERDGRWWRWWRRRHGQPAPTVALSASTNSIAAGGTTMLSASPFDPDGTIAKVEFYDDAALLATVSASSV
jgi:chitinase